jgi:radical SAM superfamily enzyme YgiQ (UPF0313 family)
MKNVLLIHPPFDSDYCIDVISDSPPLGLVVLQNYVKRHLKLNVDIDIIDGEYHSMDEMNAMISSKKYDMLGVSPVAASYMNSLKLVETAKKHNLTTVFGGHHATQLCDAILRNRHDVLDYIIVGDGEIAFAGLVMGTEPSQIPNLVYYENGQIQKTREENVPLEFGVIDYIDPKALEQYKRNTSKAIERREKLTAFKSYSHKGCSNRSRSQYCFFCGRADKGVRYKTPDDYVRELRYLSSIPSAKYIFESGDDFLQNIKWLNAVVELIEKEPLRKDVHLRIFARANKVIPETIPILKKLNIDEVLIGFESGSEKILKNICKHGTPADNMNAAKLLYENGIDTIASFVLGLPGEDEHTLQETYNQVLEIKELAYKHLGRSPQQIMPNIIAIHPGSPAFKKLLHNMPQKYQDKDVFDIYETQSDYFRMEFDLKNDEQLMEFRMNLEAWVKKIKELGNYSEFHKVSK